nr:VWA domain-containing protein [Eubacterium sp.]
GYATFPNLTVGSYTLEETQAPSGYEKLMDANGNPIQWTVTVNGQGEVTVKQQGSDTEVGKDVWDNYLICNPKVAQLPAPDHQKYIKSNDNDQYKLTLDVTGKVGEADPIDILLIVDKSGSMEGNGVTNVNTAISTLTKTLKDANIRAQVKLAVVTFSGDKGQWVSDGFFSGHYKDIAWNDADFAQNWTDLNSFRWKLEKPTGGTNWQAGIKKGEEVLRAGSGTKKYVVFLTDGNPTFKYNNSSGYTEGDGNSDSSGDNYNAAITEWNNNSPTLKAATGKYVIDATSRGSENCKTLAQTLSGNAADYLTENYLKGNDTTSITNSFKKIADAIAYPSYNNVTITDTLSDYAEFTTKDEQGRPAIQVYKGTKTYTKDTSGTTIGIQSVKQEKKLVEGTDYEYTYNPSTKTVTVKLNGKLDKDKTYWIEFDIKPTEKAYKEYLTNGGYGQTTGDLLTDAPGNISSSNKPGFYSNSSAKVTYKVDDSATKGADYDKPVIQVTTDTTKQVVEKKWIGDAKSSVDVKLTAKATIGNEEKELSHETYKSLPDQMQETLNKDNNWKATWSNLPTKYYYEDTTNKTIQSADISYSVDEVNVPQGYAKDISAPVSSENGKVITTTITNRQFIIEKVWTDKQSDSHPTTEQEVHPQSQNIVIGIYKPGTDGTKEKPFSTDNLIANVTLNKGNSWKATIPSSLGVDYKDYVIRELKEDKDGSTIINDTKYSVIKDSANMVVDNASYKVSYNKEDEAQKAYRCIVTNTRLNTITINKVDGNNQPLDGAEFSLEKKDSSNNWEVIRTKTSENGTLKFSDLEDGEYRITETKSPAGHSLLANSIDVTLPMTLDSTQEGLEKGKGITKEDGKVYYYDLTYTIKNNKLFNMPASGGRFKATLIGIAVMIMAAGCYILRHRRKRII